MTPDPSIRRKITQAVRDFVDEGKMFTAFEVSLAVKAQGVRERHRNMKDTVHEVIFEVGGPEGYTRTLRDVGAPEQAWVYHRPGDNPYRYVPLPRDDAPPAARSAALDEADEPYVLPTGMRSPVKLTTAVKAPAAVPSGAYGTDQRGRLCIPVTLLAKLGVGPGQRVNVVCDPAAEQVTLTRPTPGEVQDPDTTYTAEGDGNVRITQGTLEKAGIDHLQCYNVEGNASRITIGKYRWA